MYSSCKRDRNEYAVAGAVKWFEEDDIQNRAIRIPQKILQTNNTRKAVVILEAIRGVPNNLNILIKSNLQLMLDNLIKHLHRRESKGWVGSPNKMVIASIVANIRV